jgi:hypothetical protein
LCRFPPGFPPRWSQAPPLAWSGFCSLNRKIFYAINGSYKKFQNFIIEGYGTWKRVCACEKFKILYYNSTVGIINLGENEQRNRSFNNSYLFLECRQSVSYLTVFDALNPDSPPII